MTFMRTKFVLRLAALLYVAAAAHLGALTYSTRGEMAVFIVKTFGLL